MSMSKGEKVTQFAVVTIALCAVVVSLWQGRISQRQLEIAVEHNKLTVKPYLELIKSIDGSEGTLEIMLSNQGYGPAVIKNVKLSHEGKIYDAWNPLLAAANEGNNIRQIYNYDPNSVVAPGVDRVILRLKTPQTNKGIAIVMTYESIYNELDSVSISF
ncbi:hypothetical protein [Roseivirga misakiensis]|uniref:Uncharacterized protein n=1 Tax=Roseivirga misakiensis TaxID=1563681 RepID=A0A1E5SYJ0_9BACT|nr:hypothetical protein [Roseivirga misakiensis]OEK04189.1 hypothetical protein BFP71_11945 [Roseivirga misakiensis]